jgi:hypothetical protein
VSTLTLYRPNFCCECGCKIIRLQWHLWTSRKFCGSCLPGLRKKRWLQPMLAAVAFLVFGILIGRAFRSTTPPLLIQRNAGVGTTPNAGTTAGPASLTTATDDVYLCGARTKKGSPCSRRVHGPVRCWQHKGMPAMLPADKLIVKDQE